MADSSVAVFEARLQHLETRLQALESKLGSSGSAWQRLRDETAKQREMLEAIELDTQSLRAEAGARLDVLQRQLDALRPTAAEAKDPVRQQVDARLRDVEGRISQLEISLREQTNSRDEPK